MIKMTMWRKIFHYILLYLYFRLIRNHGKWYKCLMFKVTKKVFDFTLDFFRDYMIHLFLHLMYKILLKIHFLKPNAK